MNKIACVKRFVDTGVYQREKEDLTFQVFEDLDFSDSVRHISFFRSDFRGSNFSNVTFFRNSFDRADFVSCNIQGSKFDSVNFGNCELKNCYLENVQFKRNVYNSTVIHQCTFINCCFNDEQFLVSMFDCKFIDCTFNDCGFERSSTERLDFLRCQMTGVDFATMHAERHSFVSCELKNVCFGASYVFGYFFFEVDLESIDLLYRGEILKFRHFENSYEKLWSEKRFYECINAKVLYRNLDDVSNLIMCAFNCLRSTKIVQFRQSEMNNIIYLICFYAIHSIVPPMELMKILSYLIQFDFAEFTFAEILDYRSQIENIFEIMSSGEYRFNSEVANEIPTASVSPIIINCETDDFDAALSVSMDLLSRLSIELDIKKTFKLIDKKRGSWELVFAIPTLCAFALPIILKQTASVITWFSFRKEFSKTLLEKLKDDPSLTELESIAKIASTVQTAEMNSKELASSITRDDISELIKSIKIGIG